MKITAADLNRARREAIKVVREAGWDGPIASEIEITGGRFIVRAAPTAQPGVAPKIELKGAPIDIEEAARDIAEAAARRAARRAARG